MRPIDLFYRALNVPMRALLRSPAHGIASAHLCLLSYTGRRSGRAFTIPLSFVQEGEVVRLLSSHQTRWWKNLTGEGADVEVEIARERHRGRATALLEDGEAFRHGVRHFLTALPRDAPVYGIPLDADKRPKEDAIDRASTHVVVVEIQLEATSA